MKPTISIITVCYNEEKNIAKTIQSVLYQTESNIEYIICDGYSTDRTVEILNSYKNDFSKRDIKYQISSQKDHGIYDAMNRGINMATGEYIFFLNAGDVFHNNTVIEEMNRFIANNQAIDIFYGDVMFVNRNIFSVQKGDLELLEKKSSISHPSVFAKTKIMKENLFDLSFKIAADYNFLLQQKVAGRSFYYTGFVVSDFLVGGISTTSKKKSIAEANLVLCKNSLPPYEYNMGSIYYSMLKNKIKQLLPQKVFDFVYFNLKKRKKYESFWDTYYEN